MAGKFLNVKCKCGNEQVVYSHVTSTIECSSCKTKLAEPTGGRAAIFGKILS